MDADKRRLSRLKKRTKPQRHQATKYRESKKKH